MEIDPISSIKNIHKTENFNKTKKVSSSENGLDSVNISPEAREAVEHARIVELVKNSNDRERAEKIAELKNKINNQEYLSSAIGDVLAEKIIQSLGIPVK